MSKGVAVTGISGHVRPERAAAMDHARAFAENAAISFRALYRWFTPSSYLATRLIAPVEEMLVFGLLARFSGGVGTVRYVVIGNCLVQVCLGGLAAANTVAEERGLGTLPLLQASPVNRLVNYLQRGTMHILDSLVSVGVALVVGATLFGIDFSRADWGAVIAAILVATVSSVCLGLMLGALAMAYSNFFLLLNLLWLVILLATGVNVPVSALPGWAQMISQALPFTRSLQAAREGIAGASLASVAGLLLTELALAGAYLAVGYAVLRWLERLARRRGTYELT
jgi:ABC-2 type transport system permease protein